MCQGSSQAISDALEQFEMRDHNDTLGTLPEFARNTYKARRMSTPQPIKMRLEKNPPSTVVVKKQTSKTRLHRCRSAPDLLEKSKKNRSRRSLFQACSIHAGDLALRPLDFPSDEDVSEDGGSIETVSETSSVSSLGRQALLDEIFEENPAMFVEALWDHVTLDPDELGFEAGEVIEVTDMSERDWWFGKVDEREGWFPSTFVRLRVNQEATVDEFTQKMRDGSVDAHTVLQRCNTTKLLSKDQARTNVVNEIMHAEREYVKHLRDVVQGYVEKARKRPEMFSEECLSTIFSNIEAIYKFSSNFLKDLETHFISQAPQLSELGCCFLNHRRGFEIYSEYCNNHQQATEELRLLQRNKKYQHFFEACRLLQQMIEIPLEGFLLTPVQKICKYPLQLQELLKYTQPDHPDHDFLQGALHAMKGIAMLINERKRKTESLAKIAAWQETVQDWEGEDLVAKSSELIYSGDLTKVNSSGWSQERRFFLFDHQLVYCKKDLLWRDVMIFKGRIDMDNCQIFPIKDGRKDGQFGVTVKYGFKIYDESKDKWYLIHGRNGAEKERWLKAFEQERRRVKQDKENGVTLSQYRAKLFRSNKQLSRPETNNKDKSWRTSYQQGVMNSIPAHATLPRGKNPRESLRLHTHASTHGQHNKKSGWFPFKVKKSKR